MSLNVEPKQDDITIDNYQRIDLDELKVLAKPLQEFLTSHFNPMCSVVVDVDRVTVVSKELSTPTD